jgi:anti-anti-sigma factor
MHSCSPGQRFRYAFQVRDEALIVTWHGEASHDEVARLHACMQSILDNFRAIVVLDLSGLTYLGSLALGALVGLQRAITLRQGQLRLIRLRSEIEQIFTLSGLDKLFAMNSESSIA